MALIRRMKPKRSRRGCGNLLLIEYALARSLTHGRPNSTHLPQLADRPTHLCLWIDHLPSLTAWTVEFSHHWKRLQIDLTTSAPSWNYRRRWQLRQMLARTCRRCSQFAGLNKRYANWVHLSAPHERSTGRTINFTHVDQHGTAEGTGSWDRCLCEPAEDVHNSWD